MATLIEAVKLLVQHTGREDLFANNEMLADYSASNLITNGGMEGVFVAGVAPNWTTTGASLTPTEETSLAAVGSKSQKIVIAANASGAHNLASNTAFTITAGVKYRLRFAAYVTDGRIGRVGIFDNTGRTIQTLFLGKIDSESTWGQPTFGNNTWKHYTIDFVANVTNTTCALYFDATGDNTGTTFYLDDVSLKALTGGVDGRMYIREASEFLDQQQEHPQQYATHVVDLAASEYTIDLKYCRAVNKVWIKESGEDRGRLIQATFDYVLENYVDQLSSVDVGTPAYYAIADHRQAPAQANTTLNSNDGDWLIPTAGERITRLVLMPPAESTTTVVIQGLFSSGLLNSDYETNWWLTNKPLLVVWVAKFILEGALRSAEGMKALMEFIRPYLIGIDKDMVELQMPEVLTMEG